MDTIDIMLWMLQMQPVLQDIDNQIDNCYVENKYFDGFYLAENQHLINGCVEFGFALFLGWFLGKL
mgnify:CR=1 FL=1